MITETLRHANLATSNINQINSINIFPQSTNAVVFQEDLNPKCGFKSAALQEQLKRKMHASIERQKSAQKQEISLPKKKMKCTPSRAAQISLHSANEKLNLMLRPKLLPKSAQEKAPAAHAKYELPVSSSEFHQAGEWTQLHFEPLRKPAANTRL